MNNIIKLTKKYCILIFVLFLFLILLIFRIDIGELYNTIVSLTIGEIITIIIFFLVISLVSVIFQLLLIQFLGYKANFFRLTLIFFASISANYATPVKLGFPLTVVLLKKKESIPYSVGSSLIIIEIVVSLALSGLITLMGGLFWISDLVFINYQTLIFLLAGLILIAIITYFVLRKLLKSEKALKSRVGNQLLKLKEGFSNLKIKNLIIYSLGILFVLILNGVFLIVTLGFFDVKIGLVESVFIANAAYFLGAVSMIPLGLGVREGTLTYLLHLFTVSQKIGLSAATVQRVIATVVGYILGLISGVALGVNSMKNNNDKK